MLLRVFKEPPTSRSDTVIGWRTVRSPFLLFGNLSPNPMRNFESRETLVAAANSDEVKRPGSCATAESNRRIRSEDAGQHQTTEYHQSGASQTAEALPLWYYFFGQHIHR